MLMVAKQEKTPVLGTFRKGQRARVSHKSRRTAPITVQTILPRARNVFFYSLLLSKKLHISRGREANNTKDFQPIARKKKKTTPDPDILL